MKFYSLLHISKNKYTHIHIPMQCKDERRWINNLPSVFQRADSAMLMDSFVTVKSDCLTVCVWTSLTGEKSCLGSHLSLSLSASPYFSFFIPSRGLLLIVSLLMTNTLCLLSCRTMERV